jgi:hypothetical protein
MSQLEMRLPVGMMTLSQRSARPDKRPGTAPAPTGMSPFQMRIHRCLCLLVVSLIFEGIARKLVPPLGILIFFFKDFLTFFILFLCLTKKINAEGSRWLNVMGLLSALLVPCILLTAVNSPVLALFGAKQYVLFPTVAVAMCAAYLPDHRRQLFSLFRLVGLSVIVTTLVAVAQNRLPAGNWLNLSVGGEDLSNFSAGGYLRVSATFPFVGQYCYYLNALCFCLPAFFYLYRPASRGWLAKIQIPALLGLLIVGMFVTGSRTSVVGNLGILCASGALLVISGGWKAVSKMILPAIMGFILLNLIESQYPELFAAYSARADGTGENSNAAEMKERIVGGLLNWTSGWPAMHAPPSVFGYGLGVMSNGSDKLSGYAAQWRSGGFWTETDQATTFFEGGWYLILVWYGFRCWVIFHTLAMVLKLRSQEFRIIACFAWGYVAIIGVNGTLAIQPSESIWWWLAVGLITCLVCFERRPQAATPLRTAKLIRNAVPSV